MAKDIAFKVRAWMVKEKDNGLELSGNELLCYSFLYESSKKDGGDVLHMNEVSNAINEDKNICYCVLMALQGKGLISFDKNGDKGVFAFKITPKECMTQSVSKRKVTPKDDALFEECWKEYNNGTKHLAKAIWDKLSQEERELAAKHIKPYTQSRPNKNYRKYFETYLKNKMFYNPIYDERGNLLYDPERLADKETYRPVADGLNMRWNSVLGSYMTFSYIDGLADGYTAEDRPGGARVYSNGVFYVWDSDAKKWDKEKS